MVDNLQVPRNVAKPLEVKIEDNSQILYNFLLSISNEIKNLDKAITKLEQRIKALE